MIIQIIQEDVKDINLFHLLIFLIIGEENIYEVLKKIIKFIIYMINNLLSFKN
jgi:hypothetical protein